MLKAKIIEMPDNIKTQSLQFREGFQAYYTGKMLSENPYTKTPHVCLHYVDDWEAGWNTAHARYSQGTVHIVETPKVTSKFAMHLAQTESYEAQASWIWVRLEEANLFDDNCPNTASFESFGPIKDGKIQLVASAWWGDEDFVRFASVPVSWFDSEVLTPEEINSYVATLVAAREAEKEAEAVAAAATRVAAKRENDLAQLKMLANEYPDDAILLARNL